MKNLEEIKNGRYLSFLGFPQINQKAHLVCIVLWGINCFLDINIFRIEIRTDLDTPVLMTMHNFQVRINVMMIGQFLGVVQRY